ncbi:hypothetical protein BX666DRAFT_1878246 [Dichotomocladium elegans]|nr:hypothetical protein BX666DRAFT_1878246 [Dichotomocladium elegans]
MSTCISLFKRNCSLGASIHIGGTVLIIPLQFGTPNQNSAGFLNILTRQYGIFEQPSASTDDYAPRPDEERDENLWVDDIEEEDEEDEFSEIEHPFVKLQHPSKMSSVAGNNRPLDLLLSYGRPWCSISTCTINQTSPSANALHLSKFTGVSDVWWMLAHSDCFPWARIVKGPADDSLAWGIITKDSLSVQLHCKLS